MAPLACIQCGLRALVAGEPAPFFEETPEDHLLRCHPDPEETARERNELLAKFEALGLGKGH